MNKYLKQRKLFKFMSNGFCDSIDFVVMLVFYLLMGVFYDLGMNTALRISASIFMMVLIYSICVLVHGIIIIVMKRKLIKKGLYDFEKDNELNLRLYKEPLEREEEIK